MKWVPLIRSRRQFLASTGLLLVPSVLPADEAVPEITPASTRSVESGTTWLLKTLHRDGGCGADLGQRADIGCTAMVGLALLSAGNTPLEGPHCREVRQILSFLLRTVDSMPPDDITSEYRTQIQNKIGRHAHSFLAALFLSQVAGEGEQVDVVQPALKRLVDVITRAQTSAGNWRGQAWAPTLGTVMGWVSLRAAWFAGIDVKGSSERTARFLTSQMNSTLGGARGWMHTLYKNATGVRVLYAMDQDDSPVARRAYQDVIDLVTRDNTAFSQAGGEEYLAFHLITETMLQKAGPDWDAWFPVVRDKIIRVQNADGSWSGRHCITSRTFCTAAALLVLNAPNRYLPISQP